MIDQDAEQVRRAREGSREAFSRIVRDHQVHVRAFLSKYVQRDDVVDDLAQETFLTAYRSLSGYRPDAPLRTWLLGIARHRALRYLGDLRQRRSRPAASLTGVLDEWMASKLELESQELTAHQEQVRALEGCLEKLPPASARVIRDFYFGSRGAAEIAEETGKSEGAVWVMLMRIRQGLRRCVEVRLGESGAV